MLAALSLICLSLTARILVRVSMGTAAVIIPKIGAGVYLRAPSTDARSGLPETGMLFLIRDLADGLLTHLARQSEHRCSDAEDYHRSKR